MFYYLSKMQKAKIIDLDKFQIYIGFYSEMSCGVPPYDYDLSTGDLGTTERVAYNFEEDNYLFYSTIRQWFETATVSSGLTTMDSTYVYVGVGLIGSTLAKSFENSQGSMLGVIAYDVLAYTSPDTKDVMIKKLLFDPEDDNFDYLIQDVSQTYDSQSDTDRITSDLTQMVYVTSANTDEEAEQIQEEIRKNWKVNYIDDVNGNTIMYIQFKYQDQDRYLFFNDIQLCSMRGDYKCITEQASTVGFIGTADTIEGDLKETIDDTLFNLVGLNIVVCSIMILVTIILGIIASKRLSDVIMDAIIDI